MCFLFYFKKLQYPCMRFYDPEYTALLFVLIFCLQVAWGKLVLDRVGLIIEIFNAHAETKEAKLQVFLSRYLINVTHQVISGMRAWGALVIGICLTILLRLLLYTGRVSSAYVHED
jgi:hypothetical protein